MALARIAVPTLVVSHRHDGCDVTPAIDAERLRKQLAGARKVGVVLLDGGDLPQSEPCEAESQHGFLGIEPEVVRTIANFITSKSN